MLSRTINIIRRSICNNARMLYCTRDSLQSDLTIYYNNTKQHSIQTYSNLYIAKRFKSSRRKAADSRKKKDQESDDEESDEEDEIPAGSKIHIINIPSIRLDAISKAGFGISRNKIEELFYESKLRVNGEKVLKKSINVAVGDEIDMIVCKSTDNPDFIIVNRLVILSMTSATNNVRIKMSKDKSLLIENYDDPYTE